MKSFAFRIPVSILVFLAAASQASAVDCSTISNYSGLIAAGSCTIGSGAKQLTFSSFTFTGSASGTGTTPTDMGVSILNGAPATPPSTDALYGFNFNPGLTVSGIGVEDIHITYTVTASSAIIASLHLLVNEIATGTGSTATVNETDTCSPPATPCTLFAGSTPPAAGFHEDLEGIGPYLTVFVDKDINVTSTRAGGFAAISGVRNAVDLSVPAACLPPTINTVAAHPNVLRPADNRLVPVMVTDTVSNGCGPVSCRIQSVTSNQPPGSDAIDAGDAVITSNVTGDLDLKLRATRDRSRSGNSNGRVYTIAVRCTDSAHPANTTSKSATVLVPLDPDQ